MLEAEAAIDVDAAGGVAGLVETSAGVGCGPGPDGAVAVVAAAAAAAAVVPADAVLGSSSALPWSNDAERCAMPSEGADERREL